MKILALSTLMAAAIFTFSSCSKQTTTKVSDSQTDDNYGNGGFTWSGTAPVSGKIDGLAFVADYANFSAQSGTHYVITATMGERAITLLMPSSVKAGQIINMPDPGLITTVFGTSNSNPFITKSKGGKLRVAVNNATTIEGHFWVDMDDASATKDTLVKITDGYFKVTKE